MKDFSLDLKTGTIVIEKNDLKMVTDIEEMKQRIWLILTMQKGSFSLEPDAGFDQFQVLGNDVNKLDLQSIFKNAIMEQYSDIEDVTVTSYSIDLKTRALSVQLEIMSVDGLNFKTEGVINDWWKWLFKTNI